MAIKKSDLYSSIWAACDELRGGMDAGQYKDYVLFMLFMRYITDKYGPSDEFTPAVVIPKGASFKDMVALKGTTAYDPTRCSTSSIRRTASPSSRCSTSITRGGARLAPSSTRCRSGRSAGASSAFGAGGARV